MIHTNDTERTAEITDEPDGAGSGATKRPFAPDPDFDPVASRWQECGVGAPDSCEASLGVGYLRYANHPVAS